MIFKNHQELAHEKEPMCYSSYKIRSKNPRENNSKISSMLNSFKMSTSKGWINVKKFIRLMHPMIKNPMIILIHTEEAAEKNSTSTTDRKNF